MKHTLLFFILFLVFFEKTQAQNFRYRFSVNSSIFVTEIGDTEINTRFNDLIYSDSEKFKSEMKFGAEAEILMPIREKLEMGLEFEYNELAGRTKTAPLYNFFLTRYNPLPDTYRYPNKSLIYSTKILSILATSRFYLLPVDEETSLFLKTSAGVSFVGTDFTFLKPEYRVEYGVGVLYSRGTRNSEYPKKAAFNGGIGLGTIIEFSNSISLYADAGTSFIYSDIVNGVPNYAYIQQGEEASLEKTNSLAMAAQISIGIIYSDITVNKLILNNTRRLQKIFR
ncbi:MAG: hypothetical protein ACOCWK_02050 [Tangfeifania sp.]